MSALLLATGSGIAISAAAQNLRSLKVHTDFLAQAPTELPLASREIPLRPSSEYTDDGYVMDVPASVTGITMVFEPDTLREVRAVEAKSASGTDLGRNANAWRLNRSVHMGIEEQIVVLSFDDLEPGTNTVRVQQCLGPSTLDCDIWSLTVNRAAEISSGGTLVALNFGAEEVVPEFHEDTTQYAVELPAGQDRLAIEATVEPWWARVEMSGVAADGSPLSVDGNSISGIVPGTNTVEVNIVAEDGSMVSTYLASVTRAIPQGDASLHALQLSESPPSRGIMHSAAAGSLLAGNLGLTPAFAADIERYTARTTASRITLRAQAAPRSAVEVGMIEGGSNLRTIGIGADNGQFYSSTLSLDHGINTVEIAVEANEGNRRTYLLDIERYGSVSVVLWDLRVLEGKTGTVLDILPEFDPAILSYAARMRSSEVMIRHEADPEIEIGVVGRSASGEDLSVHSPTSSFLGAFVTALLNPDSNTTRFEDLPPGLNVVTVSVSGGDGKMTVYTLNLLVEE
ncbi:MAG: cadherin-like beta sandwich domain-containing protein [Gammaproteobacteria bacterium]|nr:cadherin-like beta sandwich domain-containing protein [Gammaproteobacteria bacterium]